MPARPEEAAGMESSSLGSITVGLKDQQSQFRLEQATILLPRISRLESGYRHSSVTSIRLML